MAFFAMGAGCNAGYQPVAMTRWNAATENFAVEKRLEVVGAEALPEGIFVIRKGGVRYVLEVYNDEGRVLQSAYLDHPVRKWLVLKKPFRVFLIVEEEPQRRRLYRWTPPSSPTPLGRVGLWTDLARLGEETCAAFRSLYETRDVAPSGVEIVDAETGKRLLRDEHSYHYPLGHGSGLVLSPVDRGIRSLNAEFSTPIGTISSWANQPRVRLDGRYVAWYGPKALGTALFVAGPKGKPHILRRKEAITPFRWSRKDLFVAVKERYTDRWSLVRYSVPSDTPTASITLPDDIHPDEFLVSPRGDIIGFRRTSGSVLAAPEKELYQEFPGLPLDAWRFSPEGDRLYFVTEEGISRVDL
ncbi:MAG: hypothetical protein D6679_09745 [Candidatus Hydrogenedentota bacterium]|nr:MAG: hypothetical protein D6679_09745 [Candidatus Hydrogenedentota bacterium]